MTVGSRELWSTVGGDNYFWNAYYRSCWTHYGSVIGDPLFLPMGSHAGQWTSAITNTGIENNRLKSHNFAVAGKLFRKHPYKAMLTYSENFGNYHAPYLGESAWDKPWGTVEEHGLKQLSFGLTGTLSDLFKVKGLTGLYGIYADYGHLYENSFGITIGLRYSLGLH